MLIELGSGSVGASTGRPDLSQRQFVLLREMMSNNGDASIVGTFDNEGGLHPPPPKFPDNLLGYFLYTCLTMSKLSVIFSPNFAFVISTQ